MRMASRPQPAHTAGTSRFRTILVCLALAAPAAAPAQDATPLLRAESVRLSAAPGAGDRVGRIKSFGMLELPAVAFDGRRFSQLSGLAWDDDDEVLYAISDKGVLFHLKPVLKDGVLAEVRLVKAAPLLDPASGKPLKGRRADSEGLDILNGRNGRKGDAELVVSFERFPRIVRYRPDGRALGEHPLPEQLKDAKAYRDSNKMLESVCVDQKLGILTVPEAPLRNEREGETHIFSLSRRSWSYPLTGGMRISAIECLGDGRLLVLERDYGRLLGRAIVALKTARLPPTAAGATAVATVVTLDASDGYQIDNFEGLARHRGNRFFMISDDNDLFLQRTLLLYFEILNDRT